jgi:hypothetical protein
MHKNFTRCRETSLIRKTPASSTISWRSLYGWIGLPEQTTNANTDMAQLLNFLVWDKSLQIVLRANRNRKSGNGLSIIKIALTVAELETAAGPIKVDPIEKEYVESFPSPRSRRSRQSLQPEAQAVASESERRPKPSESKQTDQQVGSKRGQAQKRRKVVAKTPARKRAASPKCVHETADGRGGHSAIKHNALCRWLCVSTGKGGACPNSKSCLLSRKHKGDCSSQCQKWSTCILPDGHHADCQTEVQVRSGQRRDEEDDATAEHQSDSNNDSVKSSPSAPAGLTNISDFAHPEPKTWPPFVSLPKRGDRLVYKFTLTTNAKLVKNGYFERSSEQYLAGTITGGVPKYPEWQRLRLDDGDIREVLMTRDNHELRNWRLLEEAPTDTASRPRQLVSHHPTGEPLSAVELMEQAYANVRCAWESTRFQYLHPTTSDARADNVFPFRYATTGKGQNTRELCAAQQRHFNDVRMR